MDFLSNNSTRRSAVDFGAFKPNLLVSYIFWLTQHIRVLANLVPGTDSDVLFRTTILNVFYQEHVERRGPDFSARLLTAMKNLKPAPVLFTEKENYSKVLAELNSITQRFKENIHSKCDDLRTLLLSESESPSRILQDIKGQKFGKVLGFLKPFNNYEFEIRLIDEPKSTCDYQYEQMDALSSLDYAINKFTQGMNAFPFLLQEPAKDILRAVCSARKQVRDMVHIETVEARMRELYYGLP